MIDLSRAAFEATPTRCFVVDEAGLLALVNAFGAQTLGYNAEELVGRPWLNLFHELDRDTVRAQAEGCFRERGRVIAWEARQLRRDGQILEVRERSQAVLVDDQPMLFIASEDVTEHKRLVRALKQSERYLAEAQRLTHTGSWTHDNVTETTVHYSDEAFRLFGLDPRRGHVPQLDEIMRIIHPLDRERLREQRSEVLRDGVDLVQDYRAVLPDGSLRYLQSTGRPVFSPEGRLLEYFGTVMDVSDRRRSEMRVLVQVRVTRIISEAPTLNEAMPRILRAICESLNADFSVWWRTDREADILRCKELWRVPSLSAVDLESVSRASTFGPGSDFPGKVWAERRPASIRDIREPADCSRAAIATRAGLRGAFAFPIPLGDEVLGVIECFSRDIWQADEDLLAMMSTVGSQIGQFEKRAAAVDEIQLRVGMLQSLPVAAWSVTPNGTPDIVSEQWFNYTGQTPEFVSSDPEAWMTTIHPEDRDTAARNYWEGIQSGRGFTMEARFRRAKDGMYRWHLNRAVPVRDQEGNLLRMIGTSTDVHDLRIAQEDLRNTEIRFAHMTRVITVGELTASIAHEVNQPLGAIVTSAASCTRWLDAKPARTDRVRRALERIASDGRRAAEVIQRVRALMKRQAPQKARVDINEVVAEVLELTQRELHRAGVVLEKRLAAVLPLVEADRVQLQQVFLNLIVNATEAMKETEERRRLLTILTAPETPETVRVEVRDSGAGIDPEHATRLFEPFYTTKAEGLGIGLSISRSIVEAHGGQLGSRANVPHGAVFWLLLPVNEAAAVEVPGARG